MNKKIILSILFISIVGVLFSFSVQEAWAATEVLRPNAAGDAGDMASGSIEGQYPSSGAHWDKVDEATADDATTYVYSAVGSFREDLYNLPNHSVGSGTINFVKIYYRGRCKAKDTYGCTVCAILKTNGDEKKATSCIQIASWTTYSQQYNTNPTTGSAWTWAEIDALQIGGYIGGYNATYAAQLTQLYVEIDYASITPPTVTTEPATVNLSNNQATLKGKLVSRGGASSCNVRFEYRKPGESGYPNTTSWQTISADNASFSANVSLTTQTVAGNTYHYRAVADCTAYGGGTAQGTDKQVVIYLASGGQQPFTTSSPSPTIAFSPTSFSFIATQGGSNPSSQTLEVWNSGGGTLNWSVSDNATWLTLSPTSGVSTGEHDSVALSVNISGMTADTYTATITISASGATNTPQTLTVNLTIQPGCTRADPPVQLYPDSYDGNPGVGFRYYVTVYNYDSDECGSSNFALSYSCPSGWSCSLDTNSLTISAGGDAGWTYLNVTPPSGAESSQVSVTALNQTAKNNGEGTYSGSDSAYYNIMGCTGNIALTLIPPTVAPSGSVTPSASGLSTSGCVGKTISFKQGSCSGSTVSSCTISTDATGCIGSSFSAPASSGQYTYSACIDKDNDGNYTDVGESDLGILNVTVAFCTEGGVCANPGEICCANNKLYTCQQSNPNAVFYSTPSDGYLWAMSSYGYVYIHHQYDGIVDDDLVTINVGQYKSSSGDFWELYRAALFFDTSSLPDDANITAATLSIYGSSDESSTNFDITLVSGAELNDPLVSSDYYPDLYLATESRGAFSTAGFTTSGYNNISLNGTGISEISKTGTTKFGLRSSRDINYYEPSTLERISFYANEITDSNKKPKLSVTYTGTPTWQYAQDCSYGCCNTDNDSCDPCLPPISCQCCLAPYTLTVFKDGAGSVIMPGEGTFTYDHGTIVDLVTVPDSGYQFINWTGDTGAIADPNSANTTITMNGDYTITANFEPIQHTLTISSSAGGSVITPGEGTFTYDYGTGVNLIATPDSGYQFVNWTGDTGTISDPNSSSTFIIIYGNYDIYANFESEAPNQPPIITSVSDDSPKYLGEEVTFTSIASDPDAGDTIKLYICKNSSCTNCEPGDASNCWRESDTASPINPSASLTCAVAATNNYWAKVCDQDNACSSIIPLTQAWAKTLGESGFGGIISGIQQTSDGGYIAAGITDSYGAGGADFLIIKLDSSGGREWAKTFGESGDDEAVGKEAIQQTSDGGYIAAGTTGSYGAGGVDWLVIKLNSSGNQEWAKTFGGSSSETLESIQRTSDGGYILAGRTYSYGQPNPHGSILTDVFIIKLNSSGNREWAKTFGWGEYFEGAYSIQQTSDGGYIVAGSTNPQAGGNMDMLIIKLTSSGNQEWAKTYGGSDIDYASSIQQTSDGGYIVVGDTKSYGAGGADWFIIKLTSSGNQEWAKTYGGSDIDYASSIQQTSDGGYIVVGRTYSYGAGYTDFLMIKLDSSGNREWAKTFGGSGYDELRASIQQTSDGGYIVAGGTESFGPGLFNFLIVKLNSNGDILDCSPLQSQTPLTSSPTPSTSSVTPLTSSPAPSTSSVTPLTSSPTPSTEIICAGGEGGFYTFTCQASDDTPPYRVSWVPESRDTCTNANTDVSVTVQYADADTGMAETRYCWTTGTSCTPTTLFANPDGGTTTQSDTGSWTLCVKATDNASPANSVTECKGTYIVDKIPPNSPAFSPSSRSWSNTDVSVTVTYTDNLCGITDSEYCWATGTSCTPGTAFTNGASIPQSNNGSWTLCTRARDGAGNWKGTDCSGPYQIDKVGPNIGAISPTACQVNVSTAFFANVSDNIEVADCWLYIDGANSGNMDSSLPCQSCTVSNNHTFTSAGEYSLYTLCSDEAGNPAGGPPVTVTVTPLDDAPPYLVSWDPLSRDCTNANTDVSVTVQYADADTGMAETRYCWTTGASCSPGTLFAAADGETTTQSDTGSWTLCVKATDNASPANSVTECKGTYIVDKIPPNSPAFSPSSRSWSNTDVSVTVTYTDNLCGITDSEYCWATGTSCTPGTAFTNGASIPQSNNGSWTLCTRARDGAGNWKGTDCSGPYQIDKVGPNIGAISPTACQVNVSTAFFANVSDNIEVADCWLYIDGANSGNMDSSLPCQSCTVSNNHTFTSAGEYSLYTLCSDEAGNPAGGPPVTVTVTEFAPLICDINVPSSGIVNQWIGINVSGSQGPITGVRFASDNNLNGVSEGSWDPSPLNYYGWNVSSGSWNAINKTMKWRFANSGNYEVWADITDGTHSIQCSETILIIGCYPGQTTTCVSPQGCSHTITCQSNGTWPSCPEDECARFTENDPYCSLCPEDRCIGLDWYDYPYYGTTNRASGDCDGECKCNTGIGTGQPCEPSIKTESENCSDLDIENCSNDVDDNGDGLIDCQDLNCPSTISCDTCDHSECNAFGNYDWTCHPDPAGTDCGNCRECDGDGNCLYLCPGTESSCECLYDTCIDCSDHYDGGCGYQGVCHCGPLEKPVWSCSSGQCSCVCNADPGCYGGEPDGYPDDYPEVIISPPSQEGDPGDELSYEVTIINPSDEPETYTLIPSVPPDWSYSIDKTTVTISPGQSETVDFRITPPEGTPSGEYDISVTAQNENFGTGYAEYEIPNQSPTANICCQDCSAPDCTAYTGESFTLINNSHDPDGDADIIKSEWDILGWGDDVDLDCPSTDPICDYTVQTTILGAGIYTIELYAEDAYGNHSTDEENFTLKQSAIANFKCSLVDLPVDSPDWQDCSDIRPDVDETVYFLDQSDPPEDGSIVSYSWIFQNGNPDTATGTNPSTKFESHGSKQVTLTLEVTAGLSDTEIKNIFARLPLPEWEEISPF